MITYEVTAVVEPALVERYERYMRRGRIWSDTRATSWWLSADPRETAASSFILRCMLPARSRKAVRRTTDLLQRVLAVAVLAVCLFPASTQGQVGATGSVRGKVLAGDGTPVTGALVELVGRADSVRTAGTGEFLFHGVPAGLEVLRIRAIGYGQQYQDVRVSGDSGWAGTIVLDRVVQRLPEVHVSARGKPPEFANTTKYDDFFRRRKLGFGTFRTRDDIERMGAADIASVLRGIPGVNVTTTHNPYGEPEIRFRIARCPGQPPNLAMYINGLKVTGFGRSSANKGSELSGLGRGKAASSCPDCAIMLELLGSVALPDIQFVEFYRGPSQIPSDLDRGDSCAALVIWTR